MGDLTKNFDTSEFACPCCNKIPPIETIQPLASALQAMRDRISRERGADTPIIITSGYRCEKHNQEENGSPKSQHMAGRAADIKIKGFLPQETAWYAKQVKALHGIGTYPKHVHVDVRPGKLTVWNGSYKK